MRNTANTTSTGITFDMEDRIMALLPAKIAHYLRFEAATCICTKEIFLAWRDGMSETQILKALDAHRRQQTISLYGFKHPQARRAAA